VSLSGSGVPVGELALQRGVLPCLLGVGSEEVPEEERELLGEGAGSADVDVSATVAGTFSEVALGAFGVAGPVEEPGLLDRDLEGIERLERGDRDLHVDDRLGVQARHGCRTDVVDPQCHFA
jgi:hypothetical protein